MLCLWCIQGVRADGRPQSGACRLPLVASRQGFTRHTNTAIRSCRLRRARNLHLLLPPTGSDGCPQPSTPLTAPLPRFRLRLPLHPRPAAAQPSTPLTASLSVCFSRPEEALRSRTAPASRWTLPATPPARLVHPPAAQRLLCSLVIRWHDCSWHIPTPRGPAAVIAGRQLWRWRAHPRASFRRGRAGHREP